MNVKAETVLSIGIIIVALLGVLLILHPRLEFIDLMAIIVLALVEIAFSIARRGQDATSHSETPGPSTTS